MKKNNKKAFSIIEILVGMVIFLIGVSGIFSIINSTLTLNDTNKNYIIGVNLAREQLELFRNIRDTNFSKQKGYINTTPEDCSGTCKRFEVGKTYKISNNFRTTGKFAVEIEEGKNSVSKPYNFTDLEDFKVCIFEIDESGKKYNLYDYCDKNLSSNKKELKMYKFIEVSKVENFEIPGVDFNDTNKEKDFNDTNKEKAIKVTSKVIWYSKRFQEFEVTSIFTDYKY